jgi:predicted transcriptional regulator
MFATPFSRDDMDRVTGYRALALLALVGLAMTAYNGAAILDYLQPTDEASTDDEPVADMAMATDEDDSADAGGGEEFAAAPASDEDPGGADGADLASGATGILAALLLAVMTVGLVGSLGVGILVSEGVKTGLLLALVGPLLAKLHSKEGDVQTRGRILGYVEAHPGIHFSALRDALSLANGVTAHHLHQLEKAGEAISWQDGRRRRYAASGVDPKRLHELEHPVTGMQRAILEILSDAGTIGITSTQIGVKLEASRQLMSYHLKQLSERALIAKDGRGRKATWSLSEHGAGQLSAVRESALA